MKPGRQRPLTIVAAVARNGVIGAGGRMPWTLPGDLAHFRALTWGHPLLMGRTTYESIGRPLPGRATTVLSRTAGFSPQGVAVAPDLAAALASADHQATELGASIIMVVGGGAIYAATIALAERLLITEVETWPKGDTFFPPIDPQFWFRTLEQAAPRQAGDASEYRFVQWERRRVT